MSATAGRGPTMRDDETGATGSTTTPPDSSTAAATAPGAVAAGPVAASAVPASAVAASAVAAGAAHVVTEHDVQLALSSLGLEDRALTVHRATAFLTALGVTVTHAPLPATPWSGDDRGVATSSALRPAPSSAPASLAVAVPVVRDPARSERTASPTSRVTVRIPAGDRDDDASVEGDVANLLEVLAHLQDHPPAPTPDELRSRPRVALPHAHPSRPSVRAAVGRRRSIA